MAKNKKSKKLHYKSNNRKIRSRNNKKRGGKFEINDRFLSGEYSTYLLNDSKKECIRDKLGERIGTYDINGEEYQLFNLKRSQLLKFLKECSPNLDNNTNNLGVKKAFKIIDGNPMENSPANNCQSPNCSDLVNRVLTSNNKIHIENNKNQESNKSSQEENNKTSQEEANKAAQEEANRLAQEEADRLAQEEADKAAKEEADRLAQEEANKAAKEEADRAAKEEADRAAKEEANRLLNETRKIHIEFKKITMLASVDKNLVIKTSNEKFATTQLSEATVENLSLDPNIIHILDSSDPIIFEIRDVSGNVVSSKTSNLNELTNVIENESVIGDKLFIKELDIEMGENKIIIDILISKDGCSLKNKNDIDTCNDSGNITNNKNEENEWASAAKMLNLGGSRKKKLRLRNKKSRRKNKKRRLTRKYRGGGNNSIHSYGTYYPQSHGVSIGNQYVGPNLGPYPNATGIQTGGCSCGF